MTLQPGGGDFSAGGSRVELRVAVGQGIAVPPPGALLPVWQSVTMGAGSWETPYSFCYVADVVAGIWTAAVEVTNAASSISPIDFNYGHLSVRRGRAKHVGP